MARFPWQKLPPARRPIVVDNRRIVPRGPGSPGNLYGFNDETLGQPGQISNSGISPGLPSGVSLDPSATTGIPPYQGQTDTGGAIRLITTPVVGPGVGGATNQTTDLPVPQDVICWELISICFIVNTPGGALGDRPQLTFDDGPFAASVHGNVYFISEIPFLIGAGNVRLPVNWYQGFTRAEIPQNGRPCEGTIPRNNRILSGHHIRWAFNRDIDPGVNWGTMFATACVREWRAPR